MKKIMLILMAAVLCNCEQSENSQNSASPSPAPGATSQPCPSDPAQASALAASISSAATGTYTKVSCLLGQYGYCVRYSAVKHDISSNAIETTTTTRQSSIYYNEISETKTRITSALATATCASQTKAALNLSGNVVTYQTPLNASAVKEMNYMRNCGLNNWAIGVEQTCSTTPAAGKVFIVGKDGDNLIAAPNVVTMPASPDSLPFVEMAPPSTLGTQGDAVALFTAAQGTYTTPVGCTTYRKGKCMQTVGNEVTLTPTSIKTVIEQTTCSTLTKELVVKDCQSTRNTIEQAIVDVQYFSSGAFQLELAAPVTSIAALDQTTADYYNSRFVCPTSMALGVDTPCAFTWYINPKFRVLSSVSGQLSASMSSDALFPIDADIAPQALSGVGVTYPVQSTP